MAMEHKADRLPFLRVHQQDDNLAIALFSGMARTGATSRNEARDLEIKRTQGLQANRAHLADNPGNRFITRLLKDLKRLVHRKV